MVVLTRKRIYAVLACIIFTTFIGIGGMNINKKPHIYYMGVFYGSFN